MISLQFKTTLNFIFWKTTRKKLHRLNGKPAAQSWWSNGQKCYEYYFEHNLLHRANGKTATKKWWPNGQSQAQMHCSYGKSGFPL